MRPRSTSLMRVARARTAFSLCDELLSRNPVNVLRRPAPGLPVFQIRSALRIDQMLFHAGTVVRGPGNLIGYESTPRPDPSKSIVNSQTSFLSTRSTRSARSYGACIIQSMLFPVRTMKLKGNFSPDELDRPKPSPICDEARDRKARSRRNLSNRR